VLGVCSSGRNTQIWIATVRSPFVSGRKGRHLLLVEPGDFLSDGDTPNGKGNER
jgi:hypothetical protein